MRYKTNTGTFTQVQGSQSLRAPEYFSDLLQVTIGTEATAGTIAIHAQYAPTGNWEVVYEDDGTTALVIDATAPKTFQLVDKGVHAIRFTPTGVDAEYHVTVASAERDKG
ncbi:hypothetical protein [Vibrio phage RYC]|nr:hypothetical protein [Vibrio phage RYC]